jgi:[ribosomal protein S5]-alanine N-acetyltransferase
MLTLRTDRLVLVAATLAHLDAELVSPFELGALLQARVPESWPPGEYDRTAVEFFRARLLENPEAVGWLGWYALHQPDTDRPPVVVGSGGYFGPPSSEGTVEIGYSMVPEFRGKGFATELVQALLGRAFSVPGISQVIAHTHPENIGSVTVLERCGFSVSGPGLEPGTVRYFRSRVE